MRSDNCHATTNPRSCWGPGIFTQNSNVHLHLRIRPLPRYANFPSLLRHRCELHGLAKRLLVRLWHPVRRICPTLLLLARLPVHKPRRPRVLPHDVEYRAPALYRAGIGSGVPDIVHYERDLHVILDYLVVLTSLAAVLVFVSDYRPLRLDRYFYYLLGPGVQPGSHRQDPTSLFVYLWNYRRDDLPGYWYLYRWV